MTTNCKNGFFLTVEGIDGSGKSTSLEALAEKIREMGYVVTCSREPGGTPLAETLRTLILNEDMDILTEALLAFAARRDHLTRKIIPALNRGEVVICDRFTDSTIAYQGWGREMPKWQHILPTLQAWVQTENGTLIEPDLTLWFDLDPNVAAHRMSGRPALDKFETQAAAFFSRVQQGYASQMHQNPKRVRRIDASKSISEVFSDMVSHVTEHLSIATSEPERNINNRER